MGFLVSWAGGGSPGPSPFLFFSFSFLFLHFSSFSSVSLPEPSSLPSESLLVAAAVPPATDRRSGPGRTPVASSLSPANHPSR